VSSNVRPAPINFQNENGDVDLLAYRIAKDDHKRKKLLAYRMKSKRRLIEKRPDHLLDANKTPELTQRHLHGGIDM
jgi:hypothetical protein